MAYTAAAIAAMNKRGQALLDPNKAKPATPTPAKPATTAGATTLGRGGSRKDDYSGAPISTSGTYIPSTGLGNQKVGTSSGGYTSSASTIDPGNTPPSGYDYSGIPIGGGNIDTVDQDTIDQLKQAQIAANVAALDKSLTNSLSSLDTQQAAISPYYYGKRNQAAAASDVAAMNFAQRAAARGITGNAASMPEIYRNSSLQGQIGALDQAEAAANADIERNRAALRNNYESDVAAAKMGAEANALQNYINQMNTNRNFALQEADVTGTYNGQTTLAGQAQILANKKAELANTAQEIQNSYLPYTLKKEAELLQQQVDAGRIDIDTAIQSLKKMRSSGTSSSGGLSTSLALDMWNSGIDTPAVRAALGM